MVVVITRNRMAAAVAALLYLSFPVPLRRCVRTRRARGVVVVRVVPAHRCGHVARVGRPARALVPPGRVGGAAADPRADGPVLRLPLRRPAARGPVAAGMARGGRCWRRVRARSGSDAPGSWCPNSACSATCGRRTPPRFTPTRTSSSSVACRPASSSATWRNGWRGPDHDFILPDGPPCPRFYCLRSFVLGTGHSSCWRSSRCRPRCCP